MNNDRIARDYVWYVFGYIDGKKTLNEEELSGLKIAIENAIQSILEDDYSQRLDTSTNQ